MRVIDEILGIKRKSERARSMETRCANMAFDNLMCDARAAAENNEPGVTARVMYVGREGAYEDILEAVIDLLIDRCLAEGFKEAFRSKSGAKDYVWIRWSDK